MDVDAGGGRGATVFAVSLSILPTRAVSVEIIQSRHKMATDWISRIQKEGSIEHTSDNSELINCSFLEDSLHTKKWEKPPLEIYFDNWSGAMLNGGLQFQRETKLSNLCHMGTIIVALDRMFLSSALGSKWQEELFETEAGSVDLDWLSWSQSVMISNYTRKDCNRQSRRRAGDKSWQSSAVTCSSVLQSWLGRRGKNVMDGRRIQYVAIGNKGTAVHV